VRAIGLHLLLSGCAFAQGDLEQREQQALHAAASEVAPFVVKVETIGGAEKVGESLVSSAPTSGVILDPDGYIACSEYAFMQEPNAILVELPNGERKAAKIVSRDERLRLVLLKVEVDESLSPVPIASADDVEVGQWAVTVGKTLPGDGFNMSVGIVSAKDRVWGKAFQIDANVSPANYGGALADIDGGVLGVRGGLSPNSDAVTAGSEWYDSGIGFAVRLDRVLDNLDKWKAGDLKRGLMGIAMKSENLYGAEAAIGVSRPKSPAREAGLQADDVIISANGIPVARYAQLKHILGPMLAGEVVELEIKRGEEILKKSVELTDKLVPYEHSFIGILPATPENDEPAGVRIRYVFADSPVAEAELLEGDMIVEVNGEPTTNEQALRQVLAATEPDQEIEIETVRGDEEPTTATITLATVSESVPTDLPPRFSDEESDNEDLPPLGKINVKLPEEANECLAYIPESYDPRFEHALVVLLPAPGEKKVDGLIRAWRDACDATRTVLLVPQAKAERGWAPDETQFIRKTIENLRKDYSIDGDRIVACGQGSSGSMAFLVGFEFRDLIRGIATLDGAIPSSAPGIFNEPLQRLSVWIAAAKEGRTSKRIESNVELLRKLKIPVTQTESTAEEIDDETRNAILGWIDTLDRI